VSIGAVIRAPTLRAFPLITELSNIPRISDAASETRLSEFEEFWDSEMARIGEEVGENGTLQANKEFRRHVELNSLNRTSYNWILIVNGHSMKFNEITHRFSRLNHLIKWRISTHSLLSYFQTFDLPYLK